jgi:hypothetical protein
LSEQASKQGPLEISILDRFMCYRPAGVVTLIAFLLGTLILALDASPPPWIGPFLDARTAIVVAIMLGAFAGLLGSAYPPAGAVAGAIAGLASVGGVHLVCRCLGYFPLLNLFVTLFGWVLGAVVYAGLERAFDWLLGVEPTTTAAIGQDGTAPAPHPPPNRPQDIQTSPCVKDNA